MEAGLNPMFKRRCINRLLTTSTSAVSAGVCSNKEIRTVKIEVPISAGELLDKISILRLKKTRITDPAKNANITKELDLLISVAQAHLPDYSELTCQLEQVNTQLWDVENALRLCDAEGDFGSHFLTLARQVYTLNDRRAAIKREINILSGSELVEEKHYG